MRAVKVRVAATVGGEGEWSAGFGVGLFHAVGTDIPFYFPFEVLFQIIFNTFPVGPVRTDPLAFGADRDQAGVRCDAFRIRIPSLWMTCRFPRPGNCLLFS